jgi:hypothetical protein
MARGERLVVGVGLLVAVAAGIAGGAFESVAAQSTLYAASSVGWVMATALLALHHARRGELSVAAGFLILTIAETLLWVSGRPGDPDYELGFAGGVIFYVPGLLLIGLPRAYQGVIRALAVLSAGAWGFGAGKYLVGSEFSSSEPLALAGYILLGVAFVGIAVVTLTGRFAKAVEAPEAKAAPASPLPAGR